MRMKGIKGEEKGDVKGRGEEEMEAATGKSIEDEEER